MPAARSLTHSRRRHMIRPHGLGPERPPYEMPNLPIEIRTTSKQS